MATPIKGFEGTISVSGTSVAWVSTWEVNLDVQEQTIGPFINDGGVQYTYVTSRSIKGSIEATIPSGKDAGQTTLISGALNGNNVGISLVTTNGYTVTIASGIITTFTMNQSAEETATLKFEFRSNGSFTVA